MLYYNINFKIMKRPKKLVRDIVYLLTRLTALVISLTPSWFHSLFSRFLGNFAYLALAGSRNRVLSNLRIALGKEKSRSELSRIAKKQFAYIYMGFCEAVRAVKLSPKKFANLVKIEGEEYLKEALAKGKGVVGVCAHFGNFPLTLSGLTSAGYPVNTMIREQSNPGMEKFFQELRRKLKIAWIPKYPLFASIQNSMKWLKKNGLLCILMDQHSGKGVTVDFFGHPVFAAIGAATFARRMDSVALPIFSLKNPDGTYRIIIREPIKLIKTEDVRKDIANNTACFMKIIESFVHEYPEQWFGWLHRRFR